MRITAYTYEADAHCIACTAKRFSQTLLAEKLDANGIPYEQRDNEGNLICPVFSTDEFHPETCGTCWGPNT